MRFFFLFNINIGYCYFYYFCFSEELKGKLDYYISTRFPKKVRLHRLSERAGLIRARLAGAHLSTADVMVFLDAHCEVAPMW